MMKLYKVQFAFEAGLNHIVTTSVSCKQISLRREGATFQSRVAHLSAVLNDPDLPQIIFKKL